MSSPRVVIVRLRSEGRRVEDLRLPPSNRLAALKHDRKGQWSVHINDQWRVCFRFEAGDAFDVEITDYH